MQGFVHAIYLMTHRLMHQSMGINPMFAKSFRGKAVKYGHLSAEHLQQPELDKKLMEELHLLGIGTNTYEIDIEGYWEYIDRTNYPASYYGGGLDSQQNFTEKSLEHYVSLQFFPKKKDMVFVDIAACNSPFHKIVQEEKSILHSYQQDLIYKRGLHAYKIGGYAHELPLEENSIDVVTLHCSLEHFEGKSDVQFFQKMGKLLKPGGRIIVLPFYLGYEYTIHIDPVYNFLKRHQVEIDETPVQLRYAKWRQFFSRHYSPEMLKDRILAQAPELQLSVYAVSNYQSVDPACYLRFVGVFEKSNARA